MVAPASKTAPTTPAPGIRWRKLSRRALLISAAALIVHLAVFFLLPIWISNEQGRNYVLDRLNRRLNGPRVTIDSWSLGWFRSSELNNVRIFQPDGTPLLSCPRVLSGLTLWDLVWGNYDLGNTTADNLDMRIVKFADGSTSLDSFAQGAWDIVRTARGAIQIDSAHVDIVSIRAGQTIRYADLKATITIASPDAPFHVQITALGNAAGTQGAAPANLSIRATFPPTSGLSSQMLSGPGAWSLLGDVELSAAQIPTALVCDYLNTNSAWVTSFGPTLAVFRFSGHAESPPDSQAIHLNLIVQGTSQSGQPPFINARLTARASTAQAPGSLATSGADEGIDAALLQSPPLARLLGRLNPILAESDPASQSGLIRANISDLAIPLGGRFLDNAQATLRLTFPSLLFTPRDGPSLIRQLQVVAGETPRPSNGSATHINGSASLLRAFLRDGQFSYDNFLVDLGPTRVNFSGTVGLDESLGLYADIPTSGPGLSSGYAQVLIIGTTSAPLVRRPE